MILVMVICAPQIYFDGVCERVEEEKSRRQQQVCIYMCGVVWCGVVWCGAVRCGVVWYEVNPCH